MKKNSILRPFGVLLIIALFLGMAFWLGQMNRPVNAQDPVFQTPTPNEKGYIYYEVQDGDFACEIIAEKLGTTIAEIIRLNNLDENCSIYIGQSLLIAIVDPASVTPTAIPEPVQPTEMPTEALPTQPVEPVQPVSTPVFDVGKICIVLFHDQDGNGMRTQGESFLYGGEVSINDRIGTVSRVGTTVAGDPETTNPMCFDQLPPGEYNISIAVPDGFNNTTATTHTMTLAAGDTMTIDFGAQEATPETIAQNAEPGARSPLLFILGGVILLAGLGLLVYMLRSRKG